MTTEMRLQLTNADGPHVGSPKKALQFYHDVVTSVVRLERITAKHPEGTGSIGPHRSDDRRRLDLSSALRALDWISVGRAQARAT